MRYTTVWPGWAIYYTLGNFSKLVATIILPKMPTFKEIFVKVSKSFNFSREIVFGQLFRYLVTFFWSRCLCNAWNLCTDEWVLRSLAVVYFAFAASNGLKKTELECPEIKCDFLGEKY